MIEGRGHMATSAGYFFLRLLAPLFVITSIYSCTGNGYYISASRILPDTVDVYIKELKKTIVVPYHVFIPDDCSIMMVKHIEIEDQSDVFDIGTGSGIQGIVAAKKGAKRVVATEVNPYALEAAEDNAERLGLKERFDFRLVTEQTGIEAFSVIKEDELFDLILITPPYNNGKPDKKISDFSYIDPDYILIISFFKDVGSHLKNNGRALLLYESTDEKMNMLEDMASANNLDIKILDMTDNKDDVTCTLMEVTAA